MMRKAVLLPAIYAAVVIPLALVVMSGAGTHMSPLLLYLPATPWWLVFLLFLLGAALDRRR